MALTLDPTLLAAQDSLNRRPICELTVGKGVPDFPFFGNDLANPFTASTAHQRSPVPLFQPDGQLAVFWVGYHSTYGAYKAIYATVSDPDRQEFADPVLVYNLTSNSYMALDAILLNADGEMGVAAINNWSSIELFKVAKDGTRINRTALSAGSNCYGATVVPTDTGFALIYSVLESGSYAWKIRTSADFISWSAASTITIPGLTAANEVRGAKALRVADGSYVLVLSCVTEVATGSNKIYNLYQTASADLSTWATAAAITNTTNPGQDYLWPRLAEKSDGSLVLSAEEQNLSLSMNINTPGWNQGTTSGETLTPASLWLDQPNGKLYVISTYMGAGLSNAFKGAAKIDIDSWAIEKFYNYETTPAVPGYFRDAGARPDSQFGHGPLAPIACQEGVCLINFDADTITPYYLVDKSSTYGPEAAKNIDIERSVTGNIYAVRADQDEQRLYVFCQHALFWIDLTQAAPYTANVLVQGTNLVVSSAGNETRFSFQMEDDLVLAACRFEFAINQGWLKAFVPSGNSTWKNYRRSTHPDFPYGGFYDSVYVEGKIYATVFYTTNYAGDAYKYGLAEIDPLTDQIIYHYPTWWTGPKNDLRRLTFNASTRELVISGPGGIKTFHVENKTWYWMDSTTHPDLSFIDTNFYRILYDAERDLFFGGQSDVLRLVPRDGALSLLQYAPGEKTTGWDFGTFEQLVVGYKNKESALAFDETDALWAAWTYYGAARQQARWDKANPSLSLLSYLVDEVSAEWAVDAPGRLNFTLSHGHLFDPSNANSILNFYLDKGNKAVLRFGERVGGVNYWANQGVYIVREVRLNYASGAYTLAEVMCEDVRCLWGMHQVPVAQALTQYPEAAIQAVVKANTPLTDEDFDLPEFVNRFQFDAQWLDAYLSEIVEELAHRFHYFVVADMDGKITARRIRNDAAVSHVYPTTEQLIDFTPDDSYSDLTNRVTVTGQSLSDIEVLYAEERLDAFGGTVGWWGFRKDFERWYSTDKSRRARYPRLQVVETSTSILFHLAGKIREGITTIDPDDKYCVVEVKAPNLIPVLVGAIGLYFAAGKIGDAVASWGVGFTKPVGRAIENVAICLALMVLGSTGNFQYEIWGQPVGYVKRNYSASANDEDLQARLGMVVEQKLEGFLCHLPSHCMDVAAFELMLLQLQRRRVKFSKLAHLQDEIGDTIQVPHPITGQALKIFITHLRRRYKPAVEGEGHVLDEMEGWIC